MFYRLLCGRCGIRFTFEEVKWHYCVAMVISDGRAVSDVIIFGPKLNPFFGTTAKDLHVYVETITVMHTWFYLLSSYSFLQASFQEYDNLLCPSECVAVSQALTVSLEAVLCNQHFLFRFKTKTDSLSIKRTTLLEVLKQSQITMSSPSEEGNLICSHVEQLSNPQDPPTVASVLKKQMASKCWEDFPPNSLNTEKSCLAGFDNEVSKSNSFYNYIYQESACDTSPTHVPSLHLQSMNSFLKGVSMSCEASARDESHNSFNLTQYYGKGYSFTSNTSMKSDCSSCPGSYDKFRFRKPSGPETNMLGVGGDKSNVISDNTSFKPSMSDCSGRDSLDVDDWKLLPSQLQQELIKELMTGDTSLHDDSLHKGKEGEITSSGSPQALECKHHSIHSETSDCNYEIEVLLELKEEWIATQTGSYVSDPFHSNLSVPYHDSGINPQMSIVSPFWNAFPSTQEMLHNKANITSALHRGREEIGTKKLTTPWEPIQGTRLADDKDVSNEQLLGKECSSVDLFLSKRSFKSSSDVVSSTSPDLFGEGSVTVSVNNCQPVVSTGKSFFRSGKEMSRPLIAATPQIHKSLDKRKMFCRTSAKSDQPPSKRMEEIILRTDFDQPAATSTPYLTKRVRSSAHSYEGNGTLEEGDNGVRKEDNEQQGVLDSGTSPLGAKTVNSFCFNVHSTGMSPDLL